MKVRIIEMPLDYGASRRGADMGPSAIRLAGLRDKLNSLGIESDDLYPPIHIPPQEYIDPASEISCDCAKHLGPILDACSQLANHVESVLKAGDFPLILGGDHSIALGSIAGVSAAHEAAGKKTGVLWIDAHGDFNTTRTTPSGNIHGMILAASCGYGIEQLTAFYTGKRKVDPTNVCYIGVRDLDAGEKRLMKEAGVRVFTMSDIDRRGISQTISEITTFFRERVDSVHVSFDIDAIDPRFAPGVGIEVPGGLTYREVLYLTEEMAATGMISSVDMVEVNPIHDVKNSTARMAVNLIGRLLGEKIF
ncbi:MAG TPA: arginase [Treponemataceae bacterium]|nr:arginase [Treponemataceae bacterium]